jgi:DNA-binding beta-propeller fold protein YncE
MVGVLLVVAAVCCAAASSAAASEVIRTIPVGGSPGGVSSDGTHVWVAVGETVVELSASTGELVRTIPVGNIAGGVSSDGTHVWVTLWNGTEGAVSEIDASTGEVVRTIVLGFTWPDAVSSDGTHVWVANAYGESVSEINASTGEVIRTIDQLEGDFANPQGVSSDGTDVWVGSPGNGILTEIRASTGEVLRTIKDEDNNEGVSSDGTHVWVTERYGGVAEFSASTGEFLQWVPSVPNVGRAGVSSDGKYVWVADGAEGLEPGFGVNEVSKISAATGEVVQTIPVGKIPTNVSSDGTHVWVTNEGEGTVSEIRISEPPTVITGATAEVKAKSATLEATVNPEGAKVGACVFEYGTTVSYGESVPCSPLPGSGESPVAVSGALSHLVENMTYHYRVSATSELGTSHSVDRRFTTTESSMSGSTLEPAIPAKAEDGQLQGTASEGVGTVTVGVYESDPAGPPPYRSAGVFSDIALAEGSTFRKLVFKNCALKGAKDVWWANGSGAWQPVSPSAVVYAASPGPCITVTVTESTSPDLAQMGGTRFGYGEVGAPEYGKCLEAKKANFTEGACGTVAEKKGKPDHKGKYEWFAAPVGCYAQKDGNYTESACKTVAEKKGKPDHKGKYEEGSLAVMGTIGPAKLALANAATIECTAGSSEDELTGAKTATERVTLTGCKQGSVKCSSTGEPAETIRTNPLESFIYEAGKKAYDDLTGDPIVKFSCDAAEMVLVGTVSGEATGDANSMSATGETVLKPGVGEQALILETDARTLEAGLTLTEKTTSPQAQEINTKT